MNIHVNWAIVVLALIAAAIGYSFWKAHRDPSFVQFNVFDLIMHNGRLDKIAVVFMAVFILTAWVFASLYLDGKMTEGYMTTFGVMWVAPLTAKVIFGANSTQGTAIPGQQQPPYPGYQHMAMYNRMGGVPPYYNAYARAGAPDVPADVQEEQRPTGPQGAL